MPNLSRYRLILPAWLLLLLVAVSCSSPTNDPDPTAESGASNETEDSSDSPETEDTAEPVEISFMVFGDPAELAAYQALASAFTARQDEVDVEVIHIPSQTDYRTRLAADFAAGTPADVVLINYRRYAGLAARGVLEPLGPYLEQSEIISVEDFYPESIEPFRWEGEIMCIPQNLSSLVVYYNKNLFEAAGLDFPSDDWTWDEFLATAQALTVDTDGDGRTDQFGLGTEASIFRVAPFIWQNGGDIVDDYENPTSLTIDTPEAREAIQWFVDLQVTHHVAPNAEEEAAEDSESRFQNGRLGMFLNSRRGVPTYREITAFDWDVAALPQNEEQAGILHADAYCMPSTADNKDAIWQFIEFANSPEGQTIVVASGRTVPSLIAIAESPAFLDPNAKPANSQVFLSTIPVIRGVPIMETWVDIEGTAGEELERAFYGNASVDEMIQTTIERTQDYFAPAP
jgi:multiple sugar transport system substrate-binding protein